MKETISALRQQVESLEAAVKAHREALYALQKICPHEWVDDGHDSHYNWEKCTICGVSQKA